MRRLIGLILRAAALAAGLFTLGLLFFGNLSAALAIFLLAVGQVCLSLSSLEQFTRPAEHRSGNHRPTDSA